MLGRYRLEGGIQARSLRAVSSAGQRRHAAILLPGAARMKRETLPLFC